jgi:hypothetical protein
MQVWEVDSFMRNFSIGVLIVFSGLLLTLLTGCDNDGLMTERQARANKRANDRGMGMGGEVRGMVTLMVILGATGSLAYGVSRRRLKRRSA